MSRVRFRVRTLLVAIAVLAILLASRDWFVETSQRWLECREQAAVYALREKSMLQRAAVTEQKAARAAKVLTKTWQDRYIAAAFAEDAAIDKEAAAYCGRLKRHYQSAMLRPGRRVPPRPSTPEILRQPPRPWTPCVDPRPSSVVVGKG
jgi:hypothetical protein